MNMPSFTVEASLYKTNVRYRGKYSSGYHSNDRMVVSPQACDIFKTVFCNGLIAVATVALHVHLNSSRIGMLRSLHGRYF